MGSAPGFERLADDSVVIERQGADQMSVGMRRARWRVALLPPLMAAAMLVAGCSGTLGRPVASDDPVTTLPVPANMPPFPYPSDVPPVPLPSSVPNVELPSDIPRSQLPADVPQIELPAAIPQIQLPSAIPPIPFP